MNPTPEASKIYYSFCSNEPECGDVLREDGCPSPPAAAACQKTWTLASSCPSLEELVWHTSACSAVVSVCTLQ